MSAHVPPVLHTGPTVRYLSARRVRRCFADGRGSILVLDNGDVLVTDPEIVQMLVHAIEVRDQRRVAAFERFERETNDLLPDRAPAGVPMWLLVLGLSIVGFLVFGVLGAVDGLATRWIQW
jgi:hypothetical protein